MLKETKFVCIFKFLIDVLLLANHLNRVGNFLVFTFLLLLYQLEQVILVIEFGGIEHHFFLSKLILLVEERIDRLLCLKLLRHVSAQMLPFLSKVLSNVFFDFLLKRFVFIKNSKFLHGRLKICFILFLVSLRFVFLSLEFLFKSKLFNELCKCFFIFFKSPFCLVNEFVFVVHKSKFRYARVL